MEIMSVFIASIDHCDFVYRPTKDLELAPGLNTMFIEENLQQVDCLLLYVIPPTLSLIEHYISIKGG